MAFVKYQLTAPQIEDANGDTLVGGTITAYLWDTVTPTAMYTDSAGGGSATSFTLNTFGQPSASGSPVDIFLDTAITYKFIIRDSEGTQVGPTIGPVYPNNGLSASTGAAAVGYSVGTANASTTRTVSSRLRERWSVNDFAGADLDTKLDNAIADVENGVEIYFPPSDTKYEMSGNFTLPTTKSVQLVSAGAYIEWSGTGDFITINTGTSPTAPLHRVALDMRRPSGSYGVGVGVKLVDSQHHDIDCRVVGFETGYELSIATAWCEGNRLAGLLFDNDHGIKLTRTGGNFSFASTLFDHLIITMANANAAIPYGIYIGTDLDIYRSKFLQTVVFVRKANGVGLYSDGKFRNVTGSCHFEGSGSSIGNTAWQFGPNASLMRFDVDSDIRGSITTFYDFDSAISDYGMGLRTNSLAQANAHIRMVDKAGQLRSVYDDDASTIRYIEQITASNVFQHRYNGNPEFRDHASGNIAKAYIIPLGSTPTELTIASGVITLTGNRHTVDTEADAASDDLDTINGGVDGILVTLRAANTARTVVLKNGTGNLAIGADVTLDDDVKTVTLIYWGTNWHRYNGA